MGDEISITTGNIDATGGEVNIGKVSKVITQLGATGQDELVAALRTLSKAVQTSQHLTQEQKQEQVDVIAQVAQEASKPKPNKTLLQGLGSALVTSLKAVPDVAKAVAAVAPLLANLTK
jgi:hypothetical protein